MPIVLSDKIGYNLVNRFRRWNLFFAMFDQFHDPCHVSAQNFQNLFSFTILFHLAGAHGMNPGEMEQDGEAYYRKLASEANNKGLETILNHLADEEVKHYNIFKKLRDGQTDDLPESTLLDDVTNIFEDLGKQYEADKSTPLDFSADQPQFYRKAQDLEKQSEMFYRDKAEDADDEKTKTLLTKIADEEKRHYFVLENIIDFVTHPNRWIEDAEWSKIGSE